MCTLVLGKLYLSKGTIASGGQIAAIKTNIEGAQTRLEKIDEELANAQKKKAELQELWSLATSITQTSDGMPPARGVSDKVGKTTRKIIKAREQTISSSSVTRFPMSISASW
mgnify:CR=1 FL=1